MSSCSLPRRSPPPWASSTWASRHPRTATRWRAASWRSISPPGRAGAAAGEPRPAGRHHLEQHRNRRGREPALRDHRQPHRPRSRGAERGGVPRHHPHSLQYPRPLAKPHPAGELRLRQLAHAGGRRRPRARRRDQQGRKPLRAPPRRTRPPGRSGRIRLRPSTEANPTVGGDPVAGFRQHLHDGGSHGLLVAAGGRTSGRGRPGGRLPAGHRHGGVAPRPGRT